MEATKEQKIIQQVLEEAWTNPVFKIELIESPLEAIKKLTGETFALPEGKSFKVFDQSDENLICFNIPQQPKIENMELTDNQLELVAGGGIATFLPKGGSGCIYPWPFDPPSDTIEPTKYTQKNYFK